VLGDAGEGGDRGGDEGEADAGAKDEQPEEDVAEVAAADRDLGRPRSSVNGGCRAGTSGARWRDSISTKAPSRAAEPARRTIVCGSPQPVTGASTIA
jgi:hypothetical protein